MPARPALGDPRGRDGVGERPASDPADGGTVTRLDDRLRERGVAVARRELATALDAMDDLTPAQRRTVAVMAGRIASGILAPARETVGDGAADETPSTEAVERLFGPEDEHVRDER